MYRSVLHKISLPKKQQGAALLLSILLLIVGASSLLVSKLNKASTQHYRDDVTMKALLKAKEALIGYAVSYPDVITSTIGPGHLPCPDRDNDGLLLTEGGCSFSGDTFLGRIPWRYMGIDEIRDSEGYSLWYAISDNFRYSPSGPINSEAEGELTLDSDGSNSGDDEDIVAMLLSAGGPVCAQNRLGANQVDREHFLEDINADNTPDFIREGTTASCNDEVRFNDVVMPITRSELARALEQRVNGEVRKVLKNYYANYGFFPWLVDESDFDEETFNGEAGIRKGYLPMVVEPKVDTTFKTDLIVRFDDNFSVIQDQIDDGSLVIDAGLLAALKLDFFNSVTGDSVEVELEADCEWKQLDFTAADCAASSTSLSIITSLTGMTIIDENVGHVRLMQDNLTNESGFNISLPAIASSEISQSAPITISLPLGLSEVIDGLPNWFVENDWHHLSMVAIGSSYVAGGLQSCSATTDCISVSGLTASTLPANFPAIIVSAGNVLTGQDRSTHSLSDYFESNNADISDDQFKRNTYPPDASYEILFNDQIYIIEP